MNNLFEETAQEPTKAPFRVIHTWGVESYNAPAEQVEWLRGRDWSEHKRGDKIQTIFGLFTFISYNGTTNTLVIREALIENPATEGAKQ